MHFVSEMKIKATEEAKSHARGALKISDLDALVKMQ